MLKNKKLWILILMVVILGGVGYYLYAFRFAAAAQPVATNALQTAVTRQGDLVITASGTGSVVPAKQINLGFDESGMLIELSVQEGDKVKAGDVLARIQTNNSAETIASQISEAELTVVKAQNDLNALYDNADISRTQALSDIATYSKDVRDAQYQLENYSMPIVLQGMEAVEAVDNMKAELDQALKNFEPYKYSEQTNSRRQALLLALNLAQSNYDAAVKRLDYEYVLQVAEANLAKARKDYDKYKDGPAADELSTAQATLDNAKANLALAQSEQPVRDLTAPMDGTILSIDANVGESVSTAAILTLADLDQPTLEVYLDETDLDKVAVGLPAEVVFDALPDRTFTGKVIRVSKSLQEVSNVQAIQAVVQLDPETLNPPVELPVGLSAAVDVIAGKATNALLVPVEALRELDPGEYGIFVIENGQPRLHVVQVGLMDVTTAEIKSGLQVGDIVSTGVTQVR